MLIFSHIYLWTNIKNTLISRRFANKYLEISKKIESFRLRFHFPEFSDKQGAAVSQTRLTCLTTAQTLLDFQKARDFRTFCKTATAKTIFFTRRRRLLILSSFLVMNSDAISITRSLSRQFFLGLWKSVMLRNELKIKQFPWKLSLKVRSFLFWSLDKIILGMMDFFVRNMKRNNQQE